MPILMYESENWIWTKRLIDKLEAFQGEPVKAKTSPEHCCHYCFGDANHEKQVVGDKVGFSAAGNGEQFWES